MTESKFSERDHLKFSATVRQVVTLRELMDSEVTKIRARQLAIEYLQAEWDMQRAKNAWLEEFARSMNLDKTDLLMVDSHAGFKTNPLDALMEATKSENPKFGLAKKYLMEKFELFSRITTSPNSWSEGNNAPFLARLIELL